jgi:WD40 repeat protein
MTEPVGVVDDSDARVVARDVFVSYSRGDIGQARELVARLEAAGRSVWVDWTGIPPTAEWMSEVRSGIDGCQGVVFLLSGRSLGSEVCGHELEHAEAHGKRIVPVVLEDLAPTAVPDGLARRNWVMARPGDDLDVATAQILEGLDLDLPKVREHTRILVRSAEWESSDHDTSRLLRGAELQSAEAWMSDPGQGPRPTPGQAAYVVASRRQAARRQRRLVTVVSLALVASLLLAGFAVIQRNEAQEQGLRASAQSDLATTQAASAVAITQLDRDPEVSLLLALEAARTGHTPQSDDALRRALFAMHLQHVLRPELRSEAASPTVSIGYTSDGLRVVTGGNEGGVRVWDATTGSLLGIVDGLSESIGQATAPGTSLVVSIDRNGGAQVVDAGAIARGPAVTLPAPAFSIEPGPSSGTVVVSLMDATVRSIDARSGMVGAIVASVPGGAYDATPSPDGRSLAAAGADGVVHIIVPGRAPVLVRHGVSTPFVARWAPDGRSLAVGWADGSVTIIDVARGAVSAVLQHEAAVSDMQWLPGGSVLVTGDTAGVLRAWDARSARVLADLRGHTGHVAFVAVNPDGTQVASASYDNTARLWSLAGGIPTSSLTTSRPAVGLAALPGLRSAVVAQSDGEVDVVDLPTMTVLRRLDRAAHGVPSASPDGRLVAVIASAPAPQVRVLETGTGRLVLRLTDLGTEVDPRSSGHVPSRAVSTAFDPAGARLAIATESSVRVVDVATGKVIASLPLVNDLGLQQLDIDKDGLLPRRTVAWTPDGSLVAVTAGAGARLWDPLTGSVVRWFEGHAGSAQGLAIDASGSLLVTASADKTARVYDLRTGALHAVLLGHTAQVLTAAFSPTGARVVTTGLDGTVRVWDVDGTELATYPVASVVASSARFLGDDEHLLVTAEQGANFTPDPVPTVQSGSVREYVCEVCRSREAVLATAIARVTRHLTPQERAVLLPPGAPSPDAQSPTPSGTTPVGPFAGVWRSPVVVGPPGFTGDRTVEFRPSGTVSAFDPTGFANGTYTVTGSTVVLVGVVLDCVSGDGRYTWSGSGPTITLTPARTSGTCSPTTLTRLGS